MKEVFLPELIFVPSTSGNAGYSTGLTSKPPVTTTPSLSAVSASVTATRDGFVCDPGNAIPSAVTPRRAGAAARFVAIGHNRTRPNAKVGLDLTFIRRG